MRPKDLKYNKVHKGVYVYTKNEVKGLMLDFGVAGLKSLEGGRVGNKEIENVKKVLRKNMKKRGKVWLKFFPAKGLTRKAIAVRMGKGKGNVSKWVGEVRKGKVMYEISGVPMIEMKNILNRGVERLPIKNKIIYYKT
jgi:large subunit ribosomal protein L16